MKLITFAVPCYNSAGYMSRCVDSLLTAGEEAEIILIDDGSTDQTGEIADAYARSHPSVVRVAHQENGGHGEGVNQGLERARGLYYYVVDSDDWLDVDALGTLMERLRALSALAQPIDLVVCNYVYEHSADGTQRVMRYRGPLPLDRPFGWQDTRRFSFDEFLCMHSVIYRTALLRECGLRLPKHTFYVDNLYTYQPLPFVQTLWYLDIDLYRYFIGREDQSINEPVLIRRIDQQILVTRMLTDAHDLDAVKKRQPRLAKYMFHALSIQYLICTIFLWRSGTPENLAKADALWRDLRRHDPRFYRRMRYMSCNACLLPGKLGRRIDLAIYQKVREKYKFN